MKMIIITALIAILSLDGATSVAVIELKDRDAGAAVASILTDNLISELSGMNYYELVERERMETILEEQGLQNSGLCDDSACLVKIGGLLGAQKMVTGSIGKLGDVYSLSIRMFDVETAKNDNSVTLNKKCKKDDLVILLKDAVKQLTSGIDKKKDFVNDDDYEKKLAKLKEYEEAVAAAEEKANQGKINRVCENLAGTVAATVAAYYAQYGCPEAEMIKKLTTMKSGFGVPVVLDASKINTPKDYKVEFTADQVIVTHTNGTNSSVRWR